MGDGFAHVPGDFTRAVGFGFGLARELLFEHFAHQFDGGQLLAQTVVQIVADALLFPMADFQNLPFEALPLGNVAHEAGKQAPVGQTHFTDR